MAANHPTGKQPPEEKKSLVEEADALNRVVAKLSVLSDFFRLIGEESSLLEADTTLGLYLIVGECVDALKELGGEGD